jgi:hypothetical protein
MASTEEQDRIIQEQRSSMSFGAEEIDEWINTDVDVKYIDRDNYDKFKKIKSKNGFVMKILQSYGQELYFSLVVIMAILYYLNFMKIHVPILENIVIFLPDPNMYIIIIPFLLYTLFKSFNSFSEIKMSI